eukprot:6477970-Amphidinium_carterae.4
MANITPSKSQQTEIQRLLKLGWMARQSSHMLLRVSMCVCVCVCLLSRQIAHIARRDSGGCPLGAAGAGQVS